MTPSSVSLRVLQVIKDPTGTVFAYVVSTPDVGHWKGRVEVIYRDHPRYAQVEAEYAALETLGLDSSETPS